MLSTWLPLWGKWWALPGRDMCHRTPERALHTPRRTCIQKSRGKSSSSGCDTDVDPAETPPALFALGTDVPRWGLGTPLDDGLLSSSASTSW